MSTLVQAIITGLSVGSGYALLAVGFSILFAVGRYPNFSHGYWASLPGMVAGTALAAGGGLFAAAVIAPVVGVMVGVATYVVLRFCRSADVLTVALILLALGLVLQGLCLFFFGIDPVFVSSFTGLDPVRFGDAVMTKLGMIQLITTLGLLTLLAAYLKGTRAGRILGAWSENPVAAALAGINVHLVLLSAFAISGLLAGVAGFFYAASNGVDYMIGLSLTLKAFGAAAIGGLKRPSFAAAGGFGLGLVEAFAQAYFDDSLAQVASLTLVLLVIFLLAASRGTDHGAALTGLESDRVNL